MNTICIWSDGQAVYFTGPCRSEDGRLVFATVPLKPTAQMSLAAALLIEEMDCAVRLWTVKQTTEEKIQSIGDAFNAFFDELADLTNFLAWASYGSRAENAMGAAVYVVDKPLGGMVN